MTSYTARRLDRCTPEHLDLTTRRTFLGPVPVGWVKSHRKQWYKDYISQSIPHRLSARESGFDGAVESHVEVNDAAVTDETPASPPKQIDPNPELDTAPSRTGSEFLLGTAPSTTSATSLLGAQQDDLHQAVSASPPVPIIAASGRKSSSTSTPRVRFTDASRLQLRTRARRLASRTGLKSSDIKDGALLKVDKMLVRTDVTQQHLTEYDEKTSQGVETKTLDKWREYMVVCRKHVDGDADAVLQFYQTRVLAASEERQVKTKPKDEIALSQGRTRVGIFSSLDKTLCIWTVKKSRTIIFYLKPELVATSVEWYTFIRSVMGLGRPTTINVAVPGLCITLRLADPFRTNEVVQNLHDAAAGDDRALASAVHQEAGAAHAIISRCTDMLKASPGWEDVLKLWSQKGHVGLAWRRYDRLEWVHGSVEQKMYGSLAMSKTHDLELRAMDHYPTNTRLHGEHLTEPRAVEGFLVRLTTQSGADRRLGRSMFNRLYFTTQDQFLIFVRPSHAIPPPPPNMAMARPNNAASTKQLVKNSPVMFDVDPYSSSRFQAGWFSGDDTMPEADACDRYAENDAARQVSMLLASDGFIDLCDVAEVRAATEHTSADAQTDGGAGDADADVEQVDEQRTFELVMNNNLTIRLQAFSRAMCLEWVTRLQQLVTYWTQRVREDTQLYKSVRQQNLQSLEIDERAEAVVGQFAYKWEGISQSFASPVLYNVCGISSCRAIHVAGVLYRKPRRHATFSRCYAVLSQGHVVLYQDALRRATGKNVDSVHHERTASIKLQGCYLYSGLLTEDDLLYQNQTFDSNDPSHHILPRVYLEDGWTSSDEDAMTTFVIWHGTSKSWFRSSQNIDDARDSQRAAGKSHSKLKRVGKLGATGRSMVFKARSRAERDHWVLAIQNEIERMRSTEDAFRLADST